MSNYFKIIICAFFFIIINHLESSKSDDYDEDRSDTSKFVITGGYRPSVHTHVRHMASMQFKKSTDTEFFGAHHFCAGSIISEKIIVSAAHCMVSRKGKFKAEKLMAVVGSPYRLQRINTTQVLDIAEVIPHENFGTPTYLSNDIGIFKLKDSIVWNDWTQITKLAEKTPDDGTKCIAVGWGRLFWQGSSPNEVLYVDLQIISLWKCKKRYANFGRVGMLCAGDEKDHEKDACSGDSGGPLFCDGVLAGITSFGKGCAVKGYEGAYSDVAFHADWIKENGALIINDISDLLKIFSILILFFFYF